MAGECGAAMSGVEIGILSVVLIITLIYSGLYVAVSLGVVSFVGVWLSRDLETSINLLGFSAMEGAEEHKFAIIPLFVLMGMLASRAGMGQDIYRVSNYLFQRIRGGLGIATVAANAVFAAITGVTIASASVFSRISVPEMRRYGYTSRFSVGVVVGSSVLGMLIPPSVMLIIYAVITEQSIGQMFIAGIIPGVTLAASYAIGIILVSYIYPKLIHKEGFAEGSGQTDEDLSPLQILSMGGPAVFMIFVVMGGLYGGWFTAGEAGAAGSLVAFIIALMKKKLTLRSFWETMMDTGQITATILILIVAATMYSQMLGITGMHGALGTWITSLDMGFVGFMTVFVIMLLIMGTLLDTISIILITVPLFMPVAEAFNIDLIQFGIIVVVAAEIGLLTPPLGMAVFVVKSSLEDESITLTDIFVGAFPFACIMLCVLISVIAFPQMSLGLLQ